MPLILAHQLAQAGVYLANKGRAEARSGVIIDLQETPPSDWERKKQTPNYNRKVSSWFGAVMLFLAVGFTRLE